MQGRSRASVLQVTVCSAHEGQLHGKARKGLQPSQDTRSHRSPQPLGSLRAAGGSGAMTEEATSY